MDRLSMWAACRKINTCSRRQGAGMPSALRCNCSRVVFRGWSAGDPGGEYRVVRGRRWDCPSCGLDRKRTLERMAAEAGADRIITLTFEQPKVRYVGAPPGQLPPNLVLDLAERPERHASCNPDTHLAWNERNGGLRWRLLPSCSHCLRYVSSRIALLRKRIRRLHPDFQYLRVLEVHKSGSLHVHLAVTGLLPGVTRNSLSGRRIRGAWADVGGGFVDLGKPSGMPGGAAGRYVGKYLAKRQDDGGVARGYRRWSRSALFAPEVRMVPTFEGGGGWCDPDAPLSLRGWVWSDGSERPAREWPEVTEAAVRLALAENGLDPRTAKWPHPLAQVLRHAAQAAR